MAELKALLESYIEKLDNNELSIEERLNLLEFFANDPNNLASDMTAIRCLMILGMMT